MIGGAVDNPWKLNQTNWKDSSPLGQHVEEFILENPQWVLYLRREPRFVCPDHWDVVTVNRKLGTPPCALCWGLGVRVYPIIVPSRIQLGMTNMGATEGDLLVNPGYIDRFYTAIDFPRAVKPKLEDLILTCEWDKPTQQLGQYPRARILRFNSIYQIKQVNDHFERELSWYSCGVRDFEVERQVLDNMIPSISSIRILRPEDIRQAKKFW